jgi:hypothetical protein
MILLFVSCLARAKLLSTSFDSFIPRGSHAYDLVSKGEGFQEKHGCESQYILARLSFQSKTAAFFRFSGLHDLVSGQSRITRRG